MDSVPPVSPTPGNGQGELGIAGSTVRYRKLSVLMPVFNERATLSAVVDRVLSVAVPMDMELVAVDDGSTDDSWEILEALARDDSRIIPIRHPQNRGKGAAIRTAIAQMSGDLAVVQDADLEYNPRDYARLLEPLLSGEADAVFGSRYLGEVRRVHAFWHMAVNRLLTACSNAVTNLALTDMETCYKMIRADILKQIRLSSETYTFEPEVTCRLAQWGARIYEVPISYSPRTRREGKKIRAIDGLKALAVMARARFLDSRYTVHDRLYNLVRLGRRRDHFEQLLARIKPLLGERVLELNAGIGGLSTLLLSRGALVLMEPDAVCRTELVRRVGKHRHVRIVPSVRDATARPFLARDDEFDAVICLEGVDELLADVRDLRRIAERMEPDGRLILPTLPAEKREAALARLKEAGFDPPQHGRGGEIAASCPASLEVFLSRGSPQYAVYRAMRAAT